LDGVAVDVGVGVVDSEITYDIHATFMKHGPRGSITGRYPNFFRMVYLLIKLRIFLCQF